MTASAQRLKLRLFLEGVEVPVIAATVQVVPNAPAAASIQIPPLPEGTRLLPRTLVHLFFWDPYEGAPVRLYRRGEALDPTAYEQELLLEKDVESHRYKLLFGGEVVGFQWTKNASSRSLVLQCQDWSNYWDYAYQWSNTDLFGPGYKALFSGGATNLFTDFLEDEGSAILRILQSPSVQYPNLKGLLGGIVHLLEAIGGSYVAGKQFAGENVFFSLAELRLRITQMITAYEEDPTASRLIAAGGYDGLFGRTLGGLGQQVSIRQAINALMGIIFHETYAIPTPLFVSGTGGSVTGDARRPLRRDPKTSFIAAAADALLEGARDLARDVEAVEALPIDLAARLDRARTLARTTMNRIQGKDLAQVRGFFAQALAAFDRARTAALRRGAIKPAREALLAALRDARVPLARAAEYELVSRAKGSVPARLNQQIFRPDVWFSAPPRCNVLFPDHYTTLHYQRSFLQEPTRFLLKTNDEFFGEDELFDQFYFAPKAATVKHGRDDLAAILSNDLLDHELFTGILPVFEKMGELNIFAARSGTVDGRMPKIGLAQRSANFLYFKYRFAARQMQISARFHPYVAPGFPGLIVDKYVDRDALDRRRVLLGQGAASDADAVLGTHFLANFTEVTHTLDQQNGRTEINCSYPRQVEESVEFLGAIGRDQTVRRRFGSDALRSTDVAALDPPKRFALGPSFGTITRVTDVTDAYQAQDVATGEKLPLFHGARRAVNPEARPRVPVGIAAPASLYGEDVVRLVGDRNLLVRFRAFRVEEEVPRYRREQVDLPAEEYIRPGWYGDCWHPSQIGKVYERFFRTGAITDAQQVGSPGGPVIGQAGEEAPDPLADAARASSDPRITDTPAILALDRGASVQQAAHFLVELYSTIKQAGLDIDEFLRAYTWRPIASLVDLFGTSDLMLSPDGHQVVQGVEGFHSRAFGPYEDLFGLVTPDIDSLLGIKRGSTVEQRGDTRKRKQDAVLAYVQALQGARAVVG